MLTTKKNAGWTRVQLVVVLIILAASVPSAAQNLVDIAKGEQELVVGLRHVFHQHPEVRWTEEWTLGRVKTIISQMAGLPKDPGVGFTFNRQGPGVSMIGHLYEKKGGVVVDIDFDKSFDRLLYRADVDALPVNEQTKLPFASQVPGVMHACGHDSHVAMLLGFFHAVITDKVKPKHNLRLVFQRAEENPVSKNGGQTLVEDDHVLDGVSEVYGMHIWVGDVGKDGMLLSHAGPILANNDQFFVRIKSTGGHVAMPHSGSNAIEVGKRIMDALEGFDRRSQLLGPMAPASIVPAAFLAGNEMQANVRPAEAKLTYSCRTFLNMEDRKKLAAALEQKVRDAAKEFPDAQVSFEFSYGYPATINTPAAVTRVSKLLQATGLKYEETQPSLGGEDFSYYLQQRPGADFYLAAWQQGTGGHHSPTFNPDESNLWMGVAYWLVLATN